MISLLLFLLAGIIFVLLFVAPLAGAQTAPGTAAAQEEIRHAQNVNAGKAQEAVAEQKTQSNTILIAVVSTGVTLLFGLLTLIAQQFFKMATAAQEHKWEVEATRAHRALELQRIDSVQIAVNQSNGRRDVKARSVLLIDDDPDLGPLVLLALVRCNMTMDSALDGRSAMAAVIRKPYDLVILDLGLPPGGPSGMDVLLAVKKLTTVPVIILTADGSNEAYVRSLNVGALDVLVKPFTPDALAARLQALFDC